MSSQTSGQALPFDITGGQYDTEGIYDQPSYVPGADTLNPSIAVPMNYTDVAFPTTLAIGCGLTDKVLKVRSTANYPIPPFQISLDAGTNIQEICLVGGVTPNSFTGVTRNYDGAGAFPHGVNAPVAHSTTSFDYTVMNHHTADSTTDWHGQYLDAFRHTNPTLHECGVTLGYDVPSNSAPGDTGSNGVSPFPARSDHQHGRESLTAILSNAVPLGLGVLMNEVRTDTFYWLQNASSSGAAVASPYTSFTQTSSVIPIADFLPLEPDSATIRGHVWTYLPVINPTLTFLQR